MVPGSKTRQFDIIKGNWGFDLRERKPDQIKSKFLLACTEYGDTVLHMAAEGSVTVLEKLWPF
jgi:hypothetical protein